MPVIDPVADESADIRRSISLRLLLKESYCTLLNETPSRLPDCPAVSIESIAVLMAVSSVSSSMICSAFVAMPHIYSALGQVVNMSKLRDYYGILLNFVFRLFVYVERAESMTTGRTAMQTAYISVRIFVRILNRELVQR